MADFDRSRLVLDLERDEGKRLKPYVDSVGKITIGIGRNLTDKGISPAEAYMFLNADIAEAVSLLTENFPIWRELSEARQRVLLNMTFNMGLAPHNVPGKRGLWDFQKFLEAVRSANFDLAARDMLASLWAKQVGPRAIRLSDIMKRGA